MPLEISNYGSERLCAKHIELHSGVYIELVDAFRCLQPCKGLAAFRVLWELEAPRVHLEAERLPEKYRAHKLRERKAQLPDKQRHDLIGFV